ncbi:MAG TPA: glycoside hydrolase family 99-like domain-containing protein [Candidatus Bathyarchaeia archaeon]
MVTVPQVGCLAETAHIVKFTVSTDSDWSHLTFSGFGSVLLHEYAVTKGPESGVAVYAEGGEIHVWVSKAPYDQTLVQLDVEALVLGTGQPFTVEVEKGFVGEARVNVYGWAMGRYMLLKRITHGSVPSDPARNRGVYTVDAERLRYTGIDVKRVGEEPGRMVQAVYYPWYGSPDGPAGGWLHWGNVSEGCSDASVHFPVLRAYDSLDEATVEAHVRLAMDAGIDGFLCSWWGPGSREDQAMELLLGVAGRLGFSVGAYYESLRIGLAPLPVEAAVDELTYLVDRYSGYGGYLRVGGAPVVFIYGAEGAGRDADYWRRVESALKGRVGDVVLVGDFRDPGFLRVFDGMHVYIELDAEEHRAVMGVVSESGWALEEGSIVEAMAAVKAAGSVTLHRRIRVGTVLPGYDDTETRQPGGVMPRNGSETYEGYWSRVSEAGVDWVMVTSWNEWHEGTEVEPSVEDGFAALQVTRVNAQRFKGEPVKEREPSLVAAPQPGSVRLSNAGSGAAYAVHVKLSQDSKVVMDRLIPSMGPGEEVEFKVPVGEDGALYKLEYACFGFTGQTYTDSLVFVCEADDIQVSCGYTSDGTRSIQGPGVELFMRDFRVQAGYGEAKVVAYVDVLSDPPSVEYCSLDILVDGEIVHGECWSSLDEVTWSHAGVTSPTTIGYEVTVPLGASGHEVALRCYARNTAQLSATMTSDAVSVDAPPLFTDLQITRFSGREVGGFLVVDVEAHIDSEPPGMEYCSLTVLTGDTVLGGACWTDIPSIGGYRAVSAPADLRYTLTVPADLYGELWAVAYGRSVAKVEDRVRLDGFLR